MTKTKKIGIAGRFGPRYGTRVKERIRQIESKVRERQICPNCKRKALKRVASGVWVCKKCGSKFAGGAYVVKSEVAEVV